MLHFIRPTWLWLLVPALIYLLWVLYQARQLNPWRKVCDPHLLPALVQISPRNNRFGFYLPLVLIVILSVIALAGPAWHKIQLPIYRDSSALMIALDLSPTMQLDDIKPDRLLRAKYKIRDLINAADTTQMGLIVFTSEPFVASPLSNDANTLKALLEDLSPQIMPVSGSDSAGALTEAQTLLQQSGASHGTILLITASNPSAASIAVAKTLAAAGMHVDVLAMLATQADNQATLDQLAVLAAAGGGSLYRFAADESDIHAILQHVITQQTMQDQTSDNAVLWQDAGPWICLLLIPLILLVLRETSRHEAN